MAPKSSLVFALILVFCLVSTLDAVAIERTKVWYTDFLGGRVTCTDIGGDKYRVLGQFNYGLKHGKKYDIGFYNGESSPRIKINQYLAQPPLKVMNGGTAPFQADIPTSILKDKTFKTKNRKFYIADSSTSDVVDDGKMKPI